MGQLDAPKAEVAHWTTAGEAFVKRQCLVERLNKHPCEDLSNASHSSSSSQGGAVRFFQGAGEERVLPVQLAAGNGYREHSEPVYGLLYQLELGR